MELAKILKVESVSSLPLTKPNCVGPKDMVAEAVHLMRSERVGCVLVCEGSKLVGILTERDVVRRVLATDTPLSAAIESCMTPDPITVQWKEPLSAAIRRMLEGAYRHLPVLDENDKVAGVLSVKRIIHYLVEHFPATIYNLPPHPTQLARRREGA